MITIRTGRCVGLALAALTAAAAPLLVTPPADADSISARSPSGCLSASTWDDGTVAATNTCLQSTIWVSINIWFADPACQPLDGPLTNGHGPGGQVTWSGEFVRDGGATARDVYECGA